MDFNALEFECCFEDLNYDSSLYHGDNVASLLLTYITTYVADFVEEREVSLYF